MLTYIFMIDVNLPHIQPTASPRISEFTERILVRLRPLMEGDEEIQNHVIEGGSEEEQDERTQAIKLLKTGETQDPQDPNPNPNPTGLYIRLRHHRTLTLTLQDYI